MFVVVKSNSFHPLAPPVLLGRGSDPRGVCEPRLGGISISPPHDACGGGCCGSGGDYFLRVLLQMDRGHHLPGAHTGARLSPPLHACLADMVPREEKEGGAEAECGARRLEIG